MPSRTLPPEARASQRPAASQGGTLFGAGRGLGEAEVERLRALAGPAPRAGQVERRAAQGSGLLEDFHAEAELGALPPPDVQDPGEEAPTATTTLQALLLAQMRQNAVLLERLASGSKSGDGVQDVLAAGGGSANDSSGGIKGHLAREAFIKQVSDLTSVASRVQANALQELGRTQAEPGLMREYIEKRVPLQDQRLLQTFAALTAFGWEQGFRSGNTELQGFASRLLLFIEQSALDAGKTQLGYLLSGYPDPSPLGFTARRAPGLKSFSRLTPPQWMAANLAYLKDLDYAETRIAQLGAGRPPKPPTTDPGNTATEEDDKPPKPPRRPPRRPKNPDATT
ncbi:unnamed protein product [Symbiodinium sp. CCMP2592]|nr:unnamed protein product [Symbiodinium sp. CCMP2592]